MPNAGSTIARGGWIRGEVGRGTFVRGGTEVRSIGDRFAQPEPGADIALYLSRHGVKAEVHTVNAPDIDEGDAILSWLSDAGSDLLVMGLYGHARLLELVVGGVSRRILESMTVPVLMSR